GPYTITASAGAGGSISPSGATSVACGGSQTFTITPDDKCHAINKVLVDGVSVGAVATYTFNDVQANHPIAADFAPPGPCTINGTAHANGTISPAGLTSVACGGSLTYTITPDPCYHIFDVLVDDVPVGVVTSYTFTDVQANHFILARFEVDSPYTI